MSPAIPPIAADRAILTRNSSDTAADTQYSHDLLIQASSSISPEFPDRNCEQEAAIGAAGAEIRVRRNEHKINRIKQQQRNTCLAADDQNVCSSPAVTPWP